MPLYIWIEGFEEALHHMADTAFGNLAPVALQVLAKGCDVADDLVRRKILHLLQPVSYLATSSAQFRLGVHRCGQYVV